MIGVVVFGALHLPGANDTAPAIVPSASPSAAATTEATAVDPECAPATVIEGKPVEGFPADEEWFNPTPDYLPCARWGTSDPSLDLSFASHPNLVVLNTADNTMVRAYYRTSIDALGEYGRLSDDYVIPDPNPTWPPNAVVVIDAATGEVLANYQLPGLAEPNPEMFTWSGWWEQYLSDPLPDNYLPDGYIHDAEAPAPEGSENDVVEPHVYTSSDGGSPVTIRLVRATGARGDLVPQGTESIIDENGFAPGSLLTLDEGSGVYTANIPVPDDLHLVMACSDLELLDKFVDTVTTVEQG